MPENQFEQLCNMIFEVSNLPLTACKANGTPAYWLPRITEPDEPAETNRALIEKFSLASGQNVPFIEIVAQSFFYAVIRLQDGNYLIAGPASSTRHHPADTRKLSILRNVPEDKWTGYYERIDQIPIFSFRQFLTIVSLVHYMLNNSLVSPEDILLSGPTVHPEVENNLTRALFSARENQVVHTPASFEHYILQAISDGNAPKLRQALLSPVSGSIGKMSEDPIQQEKFTFVCFVTLVTRAAIDGGVNQEMAFSLSDIYCQRVDRLRDISEIVKLSWEMCMDFTERVADTKWKNKRSPTVALCCEYISLHLHEEIDLTQLGKIVRVGPKTLSKKFRKEIGKTITDYIHQERIKEAQSLLKYTDYSISEIGYYLQYHSQSYFSSIFKKFSGITPQQYRER